MLIGNITNKETEPFVFLHGEKTVSYDKIPVAGQKIMADLNRYIQKREVVVVGPAVWSYEPVKGRLKLRAGVPVKKGTRGKLRSRQRPSLPGKAFQPSTRDRWNT